MKMTSISVFAILGLSMQLSADPMKFPYDTPMTVRIDSCGPIGVNLGEEIEVNEIGKMPAVDSIVTAHAEYDDLNAVYDDAIWNQLVAASQGAQAGLMVRAVKDLQEPSSWRERWVGLVGGDHDGWTLLEGPKPSPNSWEAEIDIDYTAEPVKVRYRVRENGVRDWTVLTNADAQDGWFVRVASEASVVDRCTICGSGDFRRITSSSGRRNGCVAINGVTERFSFDYGRLGLDMDFGDAWSLDRYVVSLVSDAGTIAITNALVPNQVNSVDLSKYVDIGQSYRYEISGIGSYRGEATSMLAQGSSRIHAGPAIDTWFGFENGRPVNAITNGNVMAVSSGFRSANPTEPAVFAASTACSIASNVTIETIVSCDDSYDWRELCGLSVSSSQGAIVLTENDNDERTWACYDASLQKWREVAAVGVGTDNGSYRIRAEFDYGGTVKRVRYYIGQDQAESPLVATDDGSSWFSLPANCERLQTVSFLGKADYGWFIAGCSFSNAESSLAVDDDSRTITLFANSQLDLVRGDLAVGDYRIATFPSNRANRLAWTDSTSRYATVSGGSLSVVGGVPLNGLSSYQSYLLGLDPTDADSRPSISFVPEGDGKSYRISLENIDPRDEAETGIAISYRLEQSSTLNFEVGEIGEKMKSPNFLVDIPGAEGEKARFYRVRTQFDR